VRWGLPELRSTLPEYTCFGHCRTYAHQEESIHSFKVPADDNLYAVQVVLDSLYHPVTPSGQEFSSSEGMIRYVTPYAGDVLQCPDSPNFGTSYRCATLGCNPDYRDWDGLVGVNNVLHVSGAEILPDSRYVVQITYNGGAGYGCRSPGLAVTTAKWGDVVGQLNGPPDGASNVLDIGAVVDKIKDLSTAVIEPRAFLKGNIPKPVEEFINIIDVSFAVDAVKSQPLPQQFAGPSACP
jgi:hypothetical protein